MVAEISWESEIRLWIRWEKRESGRKLEEPNFWKNLFLPQNWRKPKITFISKRKRKKLQKETFGQFFFAGELELSSSSVS